MRQPAQSLLLCHTRHFKLLNTLSKEIFHNSVMHLFLKSLAFSSFFLYYLLFLYLAVDCLDPTCSNNGICVNGECHCKPGWGGLHCELPRAQCPDQCHGHGAFIPDTGLCSCDPNWMGPDCSMGKKSTKQRGIVGSSRVRVNFNLFHH